MPPRTLSGIPATVIITKAELPTTPTKPAAAPAAAHPASCTCPLPPLPRLAYTSTRREYDAWEQGVTGYLLFIGARGILSGRLREPYRRGATRTADHDTVYPPDEAAGDAAPRPEARTQAALVWTAGMQAEWEAWAERESKARAVILLTVDLAIWKQVKDCWCARDMWYYIRGRYGGGDR
ncbi:hypothetical protein Q8F55_003769 [Vanrija albida]|uniref:Uncharacterized protein n=1 Tax=Vanrija albida TaxID=181172 RepID=A0ABR3Q5F9_9TREE